MIDTDRRSQLREILLTYLDFGILDDSGLPTAWYCLQCIGNGVTRDTIQHSKNCRIGKMLALVDEDLTA